MIPSNPQVENLYVNWNNDLFQRYIKLFPEGEHTTIWDGVINPTLYATSPLKIMFLNREGYTEDGNDYDVAEAIFNAIKDEQRIFPDQTSLRTHLKQYLLVLQQLASGTLPNITDEQMSEIISKNASDEKWFNYQMSHVAYCNVKKSDGQSKSNVSDLHNYAQKGIDILKEQIRFFNPSIILAGNVCEGILEDLVEWGENLYVSEDHRIAIWQIKIDDKYYPFVDMYHPSYVGLTEYYLDLLHALQAVEDKMPNYWVDRLKQPCFGTMKTISIEEKPQVKKGIGNKAEILFEQALNAKEKKDWKEAVKLFHEAAEMNYIPAFRELGKFFEEVYSKLDVDEWDYYDKYDDSKKLDEWISSEDYYYRKAAELGDKECQMKYIEDNIAFISKQCRIVSAIAYSWRRPFKIKKILQKYERDGAKAVFYMNRLLEEQYQPAIELLDQWKEKTDDITIKEVLKHLNY